MKTIALLEKELKKVPVPEKFEDGACKACYKVARLCLWHQIAGQIAYLKRADAVAKASENFRLEKAERDRYNGGCDLNHNEDHHMVKGK